MSSTDVCCQQNSEEKVNSRCSMYVQLSEAVPESNWNDYEKENFAIWKHKMEQHPDLKALCWNDKPATYFGQKARHKLAKRNNYVKRHLYCMIVDNHPLNLPHNVKVVTPTEYVTIKPGAALGLSKYKHTETNEMFFVMPIAQISNSGQEVIRRLIFGGCESMAGQQATTVMEMRDHVQNHFCSCCQQA